MELIRGRKKCPQCLKITGVRKKVCECTYNFNVKETQRKLPIELDDITEEAVGFWVQRLLDEHVQLVIDHGFRSIIRNNYQDKYNVILPLVRKYLNGDKNESEN